MSTLNQMGFVDENDNETVYDLEDSTAQASILAIEGKIPSNASSSNKMATASDITDINNKIPSNASSSNKLATISDVSAAYKPKGNATLATLPSLTADHLNWVYNMTEDFTTTSDFAEGSGKSVKAGNEVGIIDISTTSTPNYKYTVLGGFIDTSGFQNKTLDTPITVDGTQKTTVETALQAINTLAAGVKSAVGTLSSLTTTVKTSIVAAINELVTSISAINGKIPSGASSSNKMATASDVTGLQDNVIANTKLIKDTVGWSGKNLLDISKHTESNVSVTESGNGLTIVGAAASTYPSIIFSTFPAGSYTVSLDISNISVPSGNKVLVGFRKSNQQFVSPTLQITENGHYEGTITTTEETTFQILPKTDSTTAEGSVTVTNVMIRDAAILDDTYEPYHDSVKDTLRDAEVIKGKNIFNNKTNTVGGITFTVDKDGYTTESNANDERSSLNYSSYNIFMPLKAGRYFIRVFQKTAKTSGYIGLHIADSSLNKYVTIGNDTDWNDVINNGLYFTIPSDMEVGILYKVGNGSYAFMITDDSETDPTYEPYYIPLKDSMFRREEQAVLGAKNRLNAKFKNSDAPNITITPTYDDKGSLQYVTLNGTSDTEKTIIQFSARLDGDLILPNGNYKFSIGTSNENIKMQVGRNSSGVKSGSYVLLANSAYGDSELPFTQDQPYGLTTQIFAKANSSFDNVKVYPMVYDASDTDPTYQPYAMTNRELTERFAKVPFTVPATTSSLVKLADYPDGFNLTNSSIISFVINNRYGIGAFSLTYQRCFVELTSNEIQIYNEDSSNAGKTGYLILGKIS